MFYRLHVALLLSFLIPFLIIIILNLLTFSRACFGLQNTKSNFTVTVGKDVPDAFKAISYYTNISEIVITVLNLFV